MARPVLMPKMGFAMQEGKILRWLKQEGDRIERGEPLAEIETEKVNIEIEAFDSGTLLKIVAPEGATVPVGEVIAVLGEPGESVEAALRAAGAEAAAGQREAVGAGEGAEATPAAAAAGAAVAHIEPESHPELHAPAAVEQPAGPPAEAEGKLKVSPLARRVAQELGINLAEVQGTGPGGRITREDVEAYAAQRRAAAAAPPAVAAPAAPPRPAPPPVAAGPVTVQEQPLSRMRQTIARRMSESKGPVPHFYITSEIEMTEALRARQAANALLDDAQKLSINDLVLKAVALALRKFPNLNAAYAGDRVQLFSEINIGMAVAIEGGLLVPVIRNCDQKSLPQIAQEAKDLASRARSGQIRPEEFEGGTFTVSNLGMYDVESFVAIINPPQAGILAVGSVLRRPAVKDDQIIITDLMKVTLSADHRVTDGAEGARFLQEVKRLLQNPMSLFL